MIPAVITQIFNPIAELLIPVGISTKEAEAEKETHPVIVEITISKWSKSVKLSTDQYSSIIYLLLIKTY